MRKLKSILISVLVAVAAHADVGKLYTSDRLSSTLIETICQDKQGYIWIGTEYGLNKFDGYRFTTYLYNSTDSTTITDNEVVKVVCDSQGRLWVGCSKGLSRYDYEQNCFVRYRFPDGREPRVNAMDEAPNGDLLIGTAGYGLYSVRSGDDFITSEPAFRKRKNDDFFSRMFVDDQGFMWRSNHLSTFTRVKMADRRPASVKDYVSPYGPPMDYLKTSDGSLLIVCMYGILRYDYATETIGDAGFDLSTLDSRLTIRKAILGNNGNIYIGTSGQGLMVIPRDSRVLRPMNTTTGMFSLATSNVNDILEDKDNNLWIDCYQKGLYQLKEGSDAFDLWSFSRQNHSIGSSVSSIAVDVNGDALCVVQNNGVYRFDRTGKILARLLSPPGTKTIFRDRNDRFWVSSDKALYAYNPASGTSHPVLMGTGWGMNCMTDDDLGHLYVCDYGKGMIALDIATGNVSTYTMNQDGGPQGCLCNDWIKSLYIDRYGMLWIGTANGLSCFNTRTRSFRPYGWDVLLKDMQCTAIGESRDGHILVGTNSGLFEFDRVSNKLSAFPGAELLNDKLIYGIVADREGDLWVSTSAGIWQHNAKSKQWMAYINGNGLGAKEYVIGALMQTDDGMIGFGTNDGVTTFYPDDVRKSKVEMGHVYLTNFIIDGRSMNTQRESFTVAYNQNTFTLEFSLLNYANTESITFEYRINGSREWLSVPEGTNAITFTRMKPCSYSIEVRAMCNGVYSKETTTIRVTVKAPWYASWLAYLVYALAAGMLLLLGVSYYLHRRKTEMEESKMRFLINATHDIRSPLTLILGPLKKLKQRLTDAESQHDIDTIDRNAQRLLLLVNQILDERKIDKNQMQLHCRETDLAPFINSICSLYQYNAQQRGISFGLHTPKDADGQMLPVRVWIDRINFDKVVSNLLSNAFKYTFDGGEIDVEIEPTATEAVIRVIDNGIGLGDTNPARLFDRFYQGSNSRDVHIEGTGIGLNLSKAIVEMHGGKISAANRSDGKRGTVITVRLPLGNAHLKAEEIEHEPEKHRQEAGEPRKQASKNFRILIADDDAEMAAYIRSELSQWYRFDAAPNGKEALKALFTGSYDLLISDVMMPEMDGITLLKNIKGNTQISDIPVILLTSKSEVSDRLEGLKKGADAFLAKPFSMEELHILIDNLIDNVRRLRGKFSGAQQQEEKMEKVEVKGNNDALMERIMKSINENLSDPDFNVEKLTTTVGMSRAQLHRKMKEITGISTGDFIRNLRLEQAARLIRERKINVTQVAYAVGFNNQTHFSTVFKKHFGMTPTEYAEKKDEDTE